MNTVLIVVLTIAVVGGIGAVAWYVTTQREKLDPAIQAKVDAAKSARKNWKRESRKNARETAAVTRDLEHLASPKGNRISSFGGATLYERWIDTPQGGGSLIGVHAEAADESTINKRITATRLVALGVFALAVRKKSGGGNVYVVIDGPAVSGVATMPGDKQSNNGPKAYGFAAQVNNAARAAEMSEPHRPGLIQAKQRELGRLQEAREVTAAAEAFRAALAEVPAEQRALIKPLS